MSQTTPQGKQGSVLYATLRVMTIAVAILGPIAMIGGAYAITVMEADWWFPLFLAFLGGMVLIFFSLYVSLVVLLWELCRYFCRKAGLNMMDTPVTRLLHRILLPVSVVGVASAGIWILIWLDLVSGAFAWIHLICGGILIFLLVVYGIYALSRRRADRCHAEAERQAQEKQDWEGYLS